MAMGMPVLLPTTTKSGSERELAFKKGSLVQVEAEDLVLTLEGIVEKFGEEIAPYAVGLCQHLTNAFWRTLQVTIHPALDSCE